MHYKNIQVILHPEQPFISVGILKGEIWNGESLPREFERHMLRTPDGKEAFASWWELARQFSAID